jgi:MFS family permease
MPAAPATSRPTALAPFSDTRFRNLWVSSGFFFSGFWSQTVVLGWLSFELTQSEFAVAAFTAARFAPLLIGPLGGVLADRTNRPRMLRISIATAFGIGVAIATLATFGEIAYWQVLIAGLFIGLMQAPLQPVRFTLIMDIVGRDQLSSANALNMAAMFGSRIIAPAIAGWVISAGGADMALWFSAAWYVPAWIFLATFREIERSATSTGAHIVADLMEGFRIAVRHREMVGVLLASVAANVCAWPVIQGFMPLFAEQVLDVGAGGLGVLVASNGLGSLSGALVIAALGDFPRKGRLFLASTAAFGLLLAAFAVADQMPVAMVLIFLAGFASAGFGVMQSTLMLLLAPEEVRGRVMGVLMLSIGALPVSLLVLGSIAGGVGVVATTIVAGVLLAVAMVLLTVGAPGVWRLP